MSAAAAVEPDLTGRIAVVTGAGSGIGRATALLLAHHGAKVHLADINLQAAEDAASAIRATGAEAAASALDVTDAAAVEAFAEAVFADGAPRRHPAQQRRNRARREHRGDHVSRTGSA